MQRATTCREAQTALHWQMDKQGQKHASKRDDTIIACSSSTVNSLSYYPRNLDPDEPLRCAKDDGGNQSASKGAPTLAQSSAHTPCAE